MKTNISPKDWELLSEYVDQQLNATRRARLEARLQDNPELQKALEELQRTRLLLRSAPRMKAPRNFTLKPSMLPQRKSRPIYPVFQFATAVASLMLVFVLLGDLLGYGPQLGGAPGASEQPAQAFMMEDPSPETMSRSSGLPESSPNLERQMPQAEGEIVALATPEVDTLPGESPELALEPPLVPEEVPVTPEGPPAVAAAPMPASEDTQSLKVEGIQADAEAAVMAESAPDSADYGLQSSFVWSPLRVLQLSLALAVVAAGAAAIYFKRTGV